MKFIDNSKVIETFCHIFAIPNKTGETMFKTICDYLTKYDLHERIISCATDGGTSMIGKNIGFSAYFKKFKPKCVFFHCLAHRLMIGLTDVIAENLNINVLSSSVYNLTTFIKGSQNRIKLFEYYQHDYDPLKLTKPYDIR